MPNLFFFLAFFFSIKVFSCSCSPAMHPASLKKINAATEVFEGKVISQGYSVDNQFFIYHLEVIKAYKGVKEKEIVEIITMPTTASCRQYFEKNKRWLVYAFDGFTSRCYGNVILDGLSSKKINQRFSNIKKSNIVKKELLVEEYDNYKKLLAKGKQDIFGNPIGEWKYYSYKADCTYTDIYKYNSNSCLIGKSSTNTCI